MCISAGRRHANGVRAQEIGRALFNGVSAISHAVTTCGIRKTGARTGVFAVGERVLDDAESWFPANRFRSIEETSTQKRRDLGEQLCDRFDSKRRELIFACSGESGGAHLNQRSGAGFMATKVIGIDLGTTNSVVAVM